MRTLINEYKTSGTYEISWDGRDESGNLVGSGMYLYQLKSRDDNVLSTKKMLLMK
jgi:flagellar hook assembly protein FlgD